MEYRVAAPTPPPLPPETSRDLAAAETEGRSEGVFEPGDENSAEEAI
jgi:hypothetical protein